MKKRSDYSERFLLLKRKKTAHKEGCLKTSIWMGLKLKQKDI